MNNSENEEGKSLSMTFLFALSSLMGSYTFHLSRTNNIMNYMLLCELDYRFLTFGMAMKYPKNLAMVASQGYQLE